MGRFSLRRIAMTTQSCTLGNGFYAAPMVFPSLVLFGMDLFLIARDGASGGKDSTGFFR
jgi:hypothetical protein